MPVQAPKLTEEEARRLIDILFANKGVKTLSELEAELGIKSSLILTMAQRMKKAGIPVTLKKGGKGSFYGAIISSWIKENMVNV